MNKKERSTAIVEKLKELYPSAECALEYSGQAWRLVVMGILSAQCTDKRVNTVCPALFDKYPNVSDMAKAEISDIEYYIKSCGLYKTKAKNIKLCCKKITEDFGGNVPCDMERLLSLPGVGRKIANLILGDIFKLPSIVTDTHCIRLSARMGFTAKDEKNPLKTERILVKLIAPDEQVDFCHRLVLFGREYCTAKSPKCEECVIKDYCKNKKYYDNRKFH